MEPSELEESCSGRKEVKFGDPKVKTCPDYIEIKGATWTLRMIKFHKNLVESKKLLNDA